MKRTLLLAAALCLGLFGGSSTGQADSYYRINMRAYRRMMHYQMPHPFADRLWGIADNHILQTGGPFDQFIASLLARLPSNNGTNPSAATETEDAQRSVVLDQDLVNTDAKVRAMCKKLNIAYVEIPNAAPPNANVTTPQTNPTFDGSAVDSSFYAPAPTPVEFKEPGGVPDKK